MKIFASLALNKVDFGPILFKDLDIEQDLEFMAQNGFDGTDIFLADISPQKITAIRKIMESLNIESGMVAGITLASNHVNLSDMDTDNRLRSIKLVEEHIEKVAQFQGGAPIGFIRGQLSNNDSFSEYCSRLSDSLDILSSKASSLNVPVYIEPINRYECNTFPTIQSVLEFIQKYNLPSIGVLPDFFHMNIEETNIISALRLAGGKILHIHCPDSNRLVPGSGHIPFDSILKCLKRLKYKHALAIESLPGEDPYESAQSGVNHLLQCLQP